MYGDPSALCLVECKRRRSGSVRPLSGRSLRPSKSRISNCVGVLNGSGYAQRQQRVNALAGRYPPQPSEERHPLVCRGRRWRRLIAGTAR